MSSIKQNIILILIFNLNLCVSVENVMFYWTISFLDFFFWLIYINEINVM